MACVRAEHDPILGPDFTTVAVILVQSPHLLNQIPYKTVVIKKALRLFPPASSLREGASGVDIVDLHGRRYPTQLPSFGLFIRLCIVIRPAGNNVTNFCLIAGLLIRAMTSIQSKAPIDLSSWASRIALVRI